MPLVVVGVAVLMPLNLMGGGQLAQLEQLSLSNLPPGSVLLWAPLVASYGMTALVLRLLHREDAMVRRRHT